MRYVRTGFTSLWLTVLLSPETRIFDTFPALYRAIAVSTRSIKMEERAPSARIAAPGMSAASGRGALATSLYMYAFVPTYIPALVARTKLNKKPEQTTTRTRRRFIPQVYPVR